MTVIERLCALRVLMKEQGLQAYLVPTSDFHGSEYVGDYFKCREYLSGFTGSAGTLVVLEKEAGLWTDGRYFLQAADQLKGSGITLYPMGEPGVPTVTEFLCQKLTEGQTLGLDGRTLNARFVRTLAQRLRAKQADLRADLDLAGEVWKDRPALSCRPAWELATCYAGRTRCEKLSALQGEMRRQGADRVLFSALDELAWLLNIRGDDVACNPVVLAYGVAEPDRFLLFSQKGAFSKELCRTLAKDGVTLLPYEGVFEYLKQLPPRTTVWLDTSRDSYALFKSLPQGCFALDRTSPLCLPKSIKNETEMENERRAHIKDGVVVTRFIYWLKHFADVSSLTELSAAQKLDAMRAELPHFKGLSFDTISAYGPHGAIVHYEPTEETNIPLAPSSFLLVDSGGHYLEGTTDITRTISLGTLTQKEKELYTAVLRGNLNLMDAKFREGCTGRNLDHLARSPLWEQGLDYNHGTGHGVGYLLNVHEGPNNIRWLAPQPPATEAALAEGMITSDEPGLYLTDEFGIRLENLLLCRKGHRTDFGQFMYFEPLTMVPFDRAAILPQLLTAKERSLLNQYHELVYKTIAPSLTEEEALWLKEETAPV